MVKKNVGHFFLKMKGLTKFCLVAPQILSSRSGTHKSN